MNTAFAGPIKGGGTYPSYNQQPLLGFKKSVLIWLHFWKTTLTGECRTDSLSAWLPHSQHPRHTHSHTHTHPEDVATVGLQEEEHKIPWAISSPTLFYILTKRRWPLSNSCVHALERMFMCSSAEAIRAGRGMVLSCPLLRSHIQFITMWRGFSKYHRSRLEILVPWSVTGHER